jgi:hypothetical protein
MLPSVFPGSFRGGNECMIDFKGGNRTLKQTYSPDFKSMSALAEVEDSYLRIT